MIGDLGNANLHVYFKMLFTVFHTWLVNENITYVDIRLDPEATRIEQKPVNVKNHLVIYISAAWAPYAAITLFFSFIWRQEILTWLSEQGFSFKCHVGNPLTDATAFLEHLAAHTYLAKPFEGLADANHWHRLRFTGLVLFGFSQVKNPLKRVISKVPRHHLNAYIKWVSVKTLHSNFIHHTNLTEEKTMSQIFLFLHFLATAY